MVQVALKPDIKPKVVFRVGKHPRALADYPFLSRWLIRAVYFLTGYQTTSEDIAITSDEETADSMCLDGSYFYKPLYMDVALPPQAAAIGPVVWPRSEAKELYKRFSPDGVFMTRHEFEALQGAVNGLCQSR
jgi:hypothetical protein